MARIRQWFGMDELGDLAQHVAHGGSIYGIGGRQLVINAPFRDAQGNGGNYCYWMQDPDSGIISPWLPAPISTFFMRCHYRMTNTNFGTNPDSAGGFFYWFKDATELGHLGCLGTGQLVLRVAGVSLATTPAPVLVPSSGQFVTLELKIVIGDGGAGAYELRVNGIPLFSGTGDTKPGADTGINNMRWVLNEPLGGFHSCYIDDLVYDDADWVGEGVVTALKPNEAGDTTELAPTPGTSDNWQTVDEIPPSDTDYNSTTLPNKKDTYVHDSLPGAASIVKSVVTVARVARTGSDIATAYLVTGSGGVDYEDAGQAVGTVARVISKLEEVNPDTAAPWTPGEVNLSQLGVRFDT